MIKVSMTELLLEVSVRYNVASLSNLKINVITKHGIGLRNFNVNTEQQSY